MTEPVKTILLVEDDVHFLHGTRDILELEGYAVRMAENGIEALTILRDQSPLPDLIVCNYMMPQMDGIECLQEIRSDPTLAHLPFILFSAGVEKHKMELARQLGIQDFFKTPYDPYDLLACVARALSL